MRYLEKSHENFIFSHINLKFKKKTCLLKKANKNAGFKRYV